MVKHAQIICRLLPTNHLGMIDHFVWLALKGLINECFLKLPLKFSIGNKALKTSLKKLQVIFDFAETSIQSHLKKVLNHPKNSLYFVDQRRAVGL